MILRIPSMTSAFSRSLRLRQSLFRPITQWGIEFEDEVSVKPLYEQREGSRSGVVPFFTTKKGGKLQKFLIDECMKPSIEEAQNSFWKLNPADWIATLNSFAGETTRTHTRKKRRKWKMTHLLEKKSKMGLLQEEEPHQVPEELLCWN